MKPVLALQLFTCALLSPYCCGVTGFHCSHEAKTSCSSTMVCTCWTRILLSCVGTSACPRKTSVPLCQISLPFSTSSLPPRCESVMTRSIFKSINILTNLQLKFTFQVGDSPSHTIRLFSWLAKLFAKFKSSWESSNRSVQETATRRHSALWEGSQSQ